MSRPKEDKLISAKEVAALTGLSPKTIYAGKCGTEKLVRVRIGRSVRWSRNSVVEWIEQRIRQANEERADEESKSTVLIFRPRLKNEVINDIIEFHQNVEANQESG